MKKILFTTVCLLFAGAAFAQEPTKTCDCCTDTECACECCAETPAQVDVKRATPAYDDVSNVVEAIIAQYPGQVVFVDYWATWCGPCLMAMETIKPLKPWMEENNVARVYISLSNSNPAQWEAMIGDIGGNHYFLTPAEQNAVVAKYKFSGVPSYQVFNTKGELSYQRVGYPGNETMQAEFEKAK